MRDTFGRIARYVSDAVGHPSAFIVALLTIVIWAVTGPAFGFSQTWQLVVNTGTTIVTFLMVFLIQNAQNRDQQAVQLKLDELLKAMKGARTGLVDLEEMSTEQVEHLREEFRKLGERYAEELKDVAEEELPKATQR